MILFIDIISGILILAGLAGTITPILPGIPLVFGGLLLFSWYGGFEKISLFIVFLFLFLTLIGVFLDWLGGVYGAKKFGASWWGMVGAFLGLILGIVLLGPLGLIWGPIVGVVIFELASGKALKKALKAGIGTFILYLMTTLYNFTLAMVMAGFFVRGLFR